MTGNFALRRTLYTPVESSWHSGQDPWLWGVPAAFQALAAPSSGAGIPAAPTARTEHEQSRAYWATLQYLLLRRLGWTRPDRGLRWWYDQGKPVDDSTLQLVSEVWDGDGFGADFYLAWLLERQPRFDLSTPGASWAEWNADTDTLSERWAQWHRETTTSAQKLQGVTLVVGGGSDPLHLTGHFGEQGTPDPHAYLTRVDQTSRRAVFVTSTMDAWYSDLMQRGDALPTTGIESWKVDVFVKSVGFLGTYRKSFDTGLWFTGRHRHHMVGQ